MANRLKMAEQHAILVLAQRGWSHRRIGRELGIHRETVAAYVRRAAEAVRAASSKPAISIIGAEGPNTPSVVAGAGPPGLLVSADGGLAVADAAPSLPSKPAISIVGAPGDTAATQPGDVACRSGPNGDAGCAPSGGLDGGSQPGAVSAGRRSQCEPFRAIIHARLEQGLTAQRIWQDLRSEHGFTDSYQSVQRFVRHLRTVSTLPFRRMECAAGEEAQIDFGRGAAVLTPDGKRRRPHLFRIVLSCSRKGYSEVVERQTTEHFIRCIENAFHAFGGVPKTLVIDNLKAAVTKADWFDPELNPKIEAFAAHYGTLILPTKPYTPRHKGKIERGVGYAQGNALKGRTFISLAEQNRFLAEWESGVADTRIHGTTRQQVGKCFAEMEKPALLPLPETRFPVFHEAQRGVNRDGHVEVAKAYYSVPPEYLGRPVWVRWDGRIVRVFNQRLEQIAVHARREPGHFATDQQHIAARKRGGIERGAAWWLQKAHSIGTEAGLWAEALLQHRGIHGIRVLMGLVSLTRRHSHRAIEEACRRTREQGVFRLRVLRRLIAERPTSSEQFEFTTEHPLIRSLSEYGQLVHDTFEDLYMKNPDVAKHASAIQAPTFSEGREGEPAPPSGSFSSPSVPQTPSPWASFPSPQEAVGGLFHE